MAKKPVDKHSFVQVFSGREDNLQETILALFDLMDRPGVAFGTPNERARFNAARDVIRRADIVVDSSRVKIVANAADARKIAEALVVPNANGEMVAPSITDVMDAEKLPGLILERATHDKAYRQMEDKARLIRDGKIRELEEAQVKSAQEMTELYQKAQGATRTAKKLLEQKQELEAQNAALTEENQELYSEANYITRSGRVTPAKKANRITTAICCVALVAVVGLSVLGINLGSKNKGLTAQNKQLRAENEAAITLTLDLKEQLAGLEVENVILGYENKTLKATVEDLKNEVEGLKGEIEDLNGTIADKQQRYENVVDKAQQAGIMVADDVKIEDLFDAIMASTENGTSDDVKKVYANLLQCMAQYGVTKDQITDANGNYTSDKINSEVKHIFEQAVVNAQILANNEEVIADALKGTGKDRNEFATQTEALQFILENDKKEIADLEDKIEEKQSIIDAKNDEIDELNNYIDQLEERIDQYENDNSGNDNSAVIASLRAQLAAEKAKTAVLEKEVTDLESELSTTKGALNTAIKQRDEALSAAEDARQDAEDARDDAEATQNAYDALLTEYNRILEENERVNEENARLSEESERIAAENERLRAENEELKNNQGGTSTQTPSEQPGTDNNSGNVNVGDVDKDDENVNPGQGDKGEVNNPGDELGDD